MFRLLFSYLPLLSLIVWLAPVSAQQAPDISNLFEGIDLRPNDTAFIAPPREVIRPLIRSKKLIVANEISDAVEILGEVLADDSAEDFLISRGSRYFESLRSRTEMILGSVEESYLEDYRIRYGIRARKLLERGVAESNSGLLKKVSNQFFFTESGSEAAMLLGHMELSRGQPSAAQSWFSKVVRFRSTAARHDPEASILLAMCQILGNNKASAKETLVSLKQRMPGTAVSFQGKDYTLFNRSEDALPWLTSLIGDSPLASNRKFSEWLMFQGNPSRTGKTGTGMPLLLPRWEHASGSSLALQAESAEYLETLIRDNEAPAPAVQPLVVGDTIVYRDAERMYGIDFQTGKQQWSYPPEMAWNIKPNREVTNAKKMKLRQRLTIDSIYGQASSDGKLIFLIPSPGSSSQREYDSVFQDAKLSDPEDQRTYNELVAIDSDNSGLLCWRIGGPNGLDEPKLAKTYFIGEPLPLEGVLYCCCVQGNAVQLVAIDSRTGKLRWSQAIANYNSESFNKDHFRRLAGVSPSYADGKLVCLTGTGAVVALEVSTRTLLWGHEYRPPASSKMISDKNGYANAMKDAWRDSQVTISNGKVFLTPVLSRQLICLSLNTGHPVWFEEDGLLPRRVDRESSLYLAGVHHGKLILVGAEDVRAIDSQTGLPKWSLDLAQGDLLSGRGYIGDGSLFLPTTSRKVLRIDLQTGKIVESVGTNRILGNLSRARGDVISHGIDHVASFPEYQTSRKLFDGVDPDELDESTAFIRAQVLIQQGEPKKGLDILVGLATKNPRVEYASILRSCAGNFQVGAPELSLMAHQALKDLYPEVDIVDLERIKMLTRLRIGDYERSVQLGLEQFKTDFDEFSNAPGSELSDKTTQKIAATLLDVANEEPVGSGNVEGIKVVRAENQKHSLSYSEFGWERAKLVMAMQGLEKSQPNVAKKYQSQISSLIGSNMDLDDRLLEWVLDRFHVNVIEVATLESISRRFLDRGKYLAALHYVEAAIRKAEKVDRGRLTILKAGILFAGRDIEGAQRVLNTLASSDLPESQQSSLAELRKQIDSKTGAQEVGGPNGNVASGNMDSGSQWLPPSAILANSDLQPQMPLRYRLPVRYDFATPEHYRTLNAFYCPWGKKKDEFELRDESGKLLHVLRIRDSDDNRSFGYTRTCSIDIQNHVAEFTLNKLTYVLDWFQVLAGEDGNLWKFPREQVEKNETAFNGRTETVFCNGKWLYCHDTLTGKAVWRRMFNKSLDQVVSHGDYLTTWSESDQQFNTIEASTGRLIRTFKADRYFVKDLFAGKFLIYHPIRKGELPGEKEKALVGPDGPKDPAKVAERLALFDPDTGKIVWERLMSARSSRSFVGKTLCSLEPNGKLTFLDLSSGKVNSELMLPLTETEQNSIQGVDVFHHLAGWVIHVRCKHRTNRFSRGKASYRFKFLHNRLSSGPVFLVDDSRKNLVWESPIYLARMEYMKNQPIDSPAILFGRHIVRNIPGTAEGNLMQTLILDAERGVVIGANVVKTQENYSGHAIEWTQANSSLKRKLIISTALEKGEFTFFQDFERPPLPQTRVTFNAFDFKDPIFEKPTVEFSDKRVGEFRAKAIAAEKLRRERDADAAADLKKKMRIDGGPQ